MTNKDKFIGFIGTYTKEQSEGIYSFTFDTATNKIENIQVAANIDNPTYLAISKDKRFLYSIVQEGSKGGVASFSLDRSTGKLQELNRQLTEGPQPCHIFVDNEQRYLLATNYHKGTISAYTLNKESGTINDHPSVVAHHGTMVEQIPHTHYSAFTPDEKYVVVVDLGLDRLYTYELVNNTLQNVTHLTLRAGSGPRHLVFHPNGRYAYIMTEFSSEVIVLKYQADNGTFTEEQSISTIPEEFTENNQGSFIHISSDGRFIYVGNRGHNSVAVFSVDKETNLLTLVERISSEGDWPRDFSLDPTEEYIVGSNQNSNNLVPYKRNKETGTLTLLKSDIPVPNPVCIKFIG
ncbi:lactonase family protein [Lysinibacillus fusiformis]|nr:lactonase family protein [Lysinibacillus fusiformis]